MAGLIQKSGYIKPGGAGNYMKYIATRDSVEKHGEHGLFGSSPEVSLENSMKEVSEHQGPVWTFIYSLKREDAARLGYDIALVQRLLQHSSAAVTQRYIGIEPQRIEAAIEGHAQLF